ncbi:hypothetical protein PVAND_014275 [Polypedilum vanderplanki]|uniref:Uncharacterized protein n=1 Tax=Polypedilum vanderplanki TaxID=319348 RepID=A0A9J6CRU9_POLVA|nr:hypothetical protein PVAND_014275 [Polypedilum vanderplanki]
MIVPERFRYVIIVALINTFQVICHVTKTETVLHCRQLSTTILDCSSLSFTSIPNDIPNTVVALNMSFNQLTLSDTTFEQCCHQIQELDLSNNKISSVNRKDFETLTNLTTLILRNNSISHFEPETFKSNMKLERLDLSQNPLQLQQSTSDGFLINSRLEELNLDYCNLNEIPEGSFRGITQLKNLSLRGNQFDEHMDVSAFENLKSLTKLEIKNISQVAIKNLCENLVSIDSIYFEGFNLSCFIFLNEDNFEDAVVGLDLPVELPILPPPIKFITTTTTTLSTSTVTTTVYELLTEKLNSSTLSEKIETIDYSNSQNNVTNSANITNQTSVVDIDNETIKYILMGILGVTLIGILIGFICRADVCGIKTKLCRSKKSTNNRRSPTDTVSPFEEIPLNTISTNGKAIEGQG